jgi:ATP-binding cassette ChvD family protein
VAWLERFLHDFEGTVVAITHDRYFLDNVAGWILELDRGEGIPWEGNYSSWLEQKDQRLAQEASQEAARRKSIEKELEWVRQGAKGRQSKGKARLARFEELNNTEYQKRNETNELFIPPGARLGDKVVEVTNLRKSYGDRLLIDDLTFSVPKGAIVGIIGPNGAGKSTLFRMMSGQEQPDSGSITLGETVKLASVDQFRDAMDNSKTVWEEVSGGLDIMRIGNTEMPSRAYVGRFNFKGTDQGKRVGELSGGERGRLHLAKLLQVGGNVLLLDEPTNDLDIETLRALENALLEFPGCAMVISHDRWFLDRIATHILDYQDEGKVEFFEGNFTEYEEYKKRTLGATRWSRSVLSTSVLQIKNAGRRSVRPYGSALFVGRVRRSRHPAFLFTHVIPLHLIKLHRKVDIAHQRRRVQLAARIASHRSFPSTFHSGSTCTSAPFSTLSSSRKAGRRDPHRQSFAGVHQVIGHVRVIRQVAVILALASQKPL